MSEKYFAENLTIGILMDKIENYFGNLEGLDYISKIQRSYNQYYGHGYYGRSDQITPSGSQGEISSISINTYRSLLRHQFTLITSERPAFNTRPINTDYKSMSQAVVGDQILEYYLSQKKVGNHLKDATEKALVTSEGFVGLSWNADKGDFYHQDPDTQKPVMTGDVDYKTYTTLECIRDIRKEGEQDWVIMISYENKYEIAAGFPNHKDHILNLDMIGTENRWKNWLKSDRSDTDIIPFFTFYHKKSAAMPEGAYAYFVEDQILAEGALPYRHVPIYRIAPANLYNSCLGYTQGFDLLGMQQTIDSLYEAVISNNITFSRQCIQGPKGADISVSQITDGLTYIEVDDENVKLEPIQLTRSAPETYKLIETLENHMEKFTGINDVVQGSPDKNIRSGNAMALLAAQAIKFNSTLEQSYAGLLEDVGTGTLNMLQDFAEAPMFMSIVGKHNRTFLKEFNKDSIDKVSRVEVEIASALSKSTAGKMEIANNLLQQGMIKRPEQYLMVLETGKLEPIIEAEESELLNIKAENEVLREGGEVIVVAIDDHPLHIREHKAVINDPEARKEPQVVQATLDHIQNHIMEWQAQDPNILTSLGIQPIGAPPAGQEGGQEGMPTDVLQQLPPDQNIDGLPSLPSLPEGSPEMDQNALQQMNLQNP